MLGAKTIKFELTRDIFYSFVVKRAQEQLLKLMPFSQFVSYLTEEYLILAVYCHSATMEATRIV